MITLPTSITREDIQRELCIVDFAATFESELGGEPGVGGHYSKYKDLKFSEVVEMLAPGGFRMTFAPEDISSEQRVSDAIVASVNALWVRPKLTSS